MEEVIVGFSNMDMLVAFLSGMVISSISMVLLVVSLLRHRR